MSAVLSFLSRIMLVTIVAIDLYIIANISVYYLEIKSMKDYFRPGNEWLSDYPQYFLIGFGVLVALAALSAEPRRIPTTLIFGAVGMVLFNMFGKTFSTSLFSIF